MAAELENGQHARVDDAHRVDFLERCAETPGASLGEGAFSAGPAIWVGKREVAHFDGSDAVDVRLTRSVIRERRDELRGDERIELRSRSSDWLRVSARTPSELHHACALIQAAVAANLLTARPGPPPTGVELARRRRFH